MAATGREGTTEFASSVNDPSYNTVYYNKTNENKLFKTMVPPAICMNNTYGSCYHHYICKRLLLVQLKRYMICSVVVVLELLQFVLEFVLVQL